MIPRNLNDNFGSKDDFLAWNADLDFMHLKVTFSCGAQDVPRALYMLGQCFTNDLHPQLRNSLLFLIFCEGW